jgi:hypothetical protein
MKGRVKRLNVLDTRNWNGWLLDPDNRYQKLSKTRNILDTIYDSAVTSRSDQVQKSIHKTNYISAITDRHLTLTNH